MKKTKKIIAIFALLIIGLSIAILWRNLNMYVVKPGEIKKNPYISTPIPIDREAEYEFQINEITWPYKYQNSNNLLIIFMKFECINNVNNIDYKMSDLKINISVIGCMKNKKFNRLVLNNDYPDSIINIKDLEDYSRTFYLGLINNFEEEELLLKVKVITPDEKLNLASPRIYINSYKETHSDYGYSVASFIYKVVLVISLILIICLIICFLRL